VPQITDDDRTTAGGLAHTAYQFLEAAIVLEQKLGKQWPDARQPPMTAYFLAFHGIELTFKAYLRHRGIPLHELRAKKKYGHDLRRCYRKSKELGLFSIFPIKASDLQAMRNLIELNKMDALRYIRTEPKSLPRWEYLSAFFRRLHGAVAREVGYRKTFRAGE
jgi:hypothetical protein